MSLSGRLNWRIASSRAPRDVPPSMRRNFIRWPPITRHCRYWPMMSRVLVIVLNSRTRWPDLKSLTSRRSSTAILQLRQTAAAGGP